MRLRPVRLAMLYWGLVPAWAKDKSVGARMINARAETLRDKPPIAVRIAAGAPWWQPMATTNG